MKSIKIGGKPLFIVVGIFILVGWFYWFQYRPAKIKHDCSWIKTKINTKINTNNTSSLKQDGGIYADLVPTGQLQVSKETYSKASKSEYDFCLHNKGL